MCVCMREAEEKAVGTIEGDQNECCTACYDLIGFKITH